MTPTAGKMNYHPSALGGLVVGRHACSMMPKEGGGPRGKTCGMSCCSARSSVAARLSSSFAGSMRSIAMGRVEVSCMLCTCTRLMLSITLWVVSIHVGSGSGSGRGISARADDTSGTRGWTKDAAATGLRDTTIGAKKAAGETITEFSGLETMVVFPEDDFCVPVCIRKGRSGTRRAIRPSTRRPAKIVSSAP